MRTGDRARYAHGVVLGKFYPPHLGHHLLVRAAAEAAARVTVVVTRAQVESIPLADRVSWLRQVHADAPHVDVVGMPCDIPYDLGSDPIWAAHVANLRAALAQDGGPPVDAVFSSEKYGDELAARLGATHVPVDPSRVHVPVSGTAVRAGLADQWDLLHPVVRAGLTTRVVVLGAESTGTTTLSTALAAHYRARGGVWTRTRWVPEFGREYSAAKLQAALRVASATGLPVPVLADLTWDSQEFAAIAERQNELERAAARAGSPVLFCDTDALATTVWERRYVGPGSHASRHAATVGLAPRAIYLLTDHVGVPWEDDGLRDGEDVRAWMTGWFADALTAAGHSWVLLTGSRQDRLDLAVRVTDRLLEHRASFGAPLG